MRLHPPSPRTLLIALIVMTSARAELPSKIDIPPEPEYPNTSGLSAEGKNTVFQKWQVERKHWSDSLTEDQRAAVDRRREEERERFGRLPLPTDGYDWRRVAASRKVSAAGIAQLAEKKILIGRQQFLQSFEPYDGAQIPVFITSDSLLNAFHVLFEDTFKELEIRRAVQLRRTLEQTVTSLREKLKAPAYPCEAIALAWRHAQRAVGPAMVLLGTSLDFFDADFREEIAAQVGKIRGASALELPAWLAPATDDFLAIDYRRLKPVGFYSSGTFLSDYFRAVRWLQMVPYRIERDAEFGAIALLGAGIPWRYRGGSQNYFEAYERFLGAPDGRSLREAQRLFPDSDEPIVADWIVKMRKSCGWGDETANAVQLNDDLRTRSPAVVSKRPAPFRVLAAYRLPDAVLFQKLGDHGEPVTGLQVAALVGSSWAEGRLKTSQNEFAATALKVAIEAFRPEGETRYDASLYDQYLDVIGALFAPVDPDAPAFMGSDAWSSKSCQTALAGWTQMRHTFTLQAKQTVVTLGIHDLPPGFIEPNPVFFRKFSEMLEHARSLLDGEGVFEASGQSAAVALREKADAVDRLAEKTCGARTEHELYAIPDYENFVMDPLRVGDSVLAAIPPEIFHEIVDGRRDPAELAKVLPRFSAELRRVAARFERGELKPDAEREYESLAYRWRELQGTVARLEALLQKQLRQRAWSEEEAAFIKGYGSTLASIMGYFGNSYQPRDDAPRWVEVLRDLRRNNSLAAATGRPQAFYVLYPWQGMEVLCEGAILPYFEYRATGVLTDDEWREQLDSSDAPPHPDWVQGLFEKR